MLYHALRHKIYDGCKELNFKDRGEATGRKELNVQATFESKILDHRYEQRLLR